MNGTQSRIAAVWGACLFACFFITAATAAPLIPPIVSNDATRNETLTHRVHGKHANCAVRGGGRGHRHTSDGGRVGCAGRGAESQPRQADRNRRIRANAEQRARRKAAKRAEAQANARKRARIQERNRAIESERKRRRAARRARTEAAERARAEVRKRARAEQVKRERQAAQRD